MSKESIGGLMSVIGSVIGVALLMDNGNQLNQLTDRYTDGLINCGKVERQILTGSEMQTSFKNFFTGESGKTEAVNKLEGLIPTTCQPLQEQLKKDIDNLRKDL